MLDILRCFDFMIPLPEFPSSQSHETSLKMKNIENEQTWKKIGTCEQLGEDLEENFETASLIETKELKRVEENLQDFFLAELI